jgi:hypothetical protein
MRFACCILVYEDRKKRRAGAICDPWAAMETEY